MRLFWMPVPPGLSEAFRVCRTHFLLAATFSALLNILYLAPTIYMMQVYDRVVPTNGVLTLIFITVVVGVAIATLSALDAIRVRLMTRARSEEHTSELQSLMRISYAVFCLKKKKNNHNR